MERATQARSVTVEASADELLEPTHGMQRQGAENSDGDSSDQGERGMEYEKTEQSGMCHPVI